MISGTILYVDRDADERFIAEPRGSKNNPLNSIRLAMAEIERRRDASYQNPYYVHLAPGVYRERVVVRSPFVRLVGIGGVNNVVILPTSGPAILVTNATLGSIETFLAASGDLVANADAQFGLLQADPELVFPGGLSHPTGFSMTGITLSNFTKAQTTHFCFMAINAGDGADGFSSVDGDRLVRDCTFDEGVYIRNTFSWRLFSNYVRGPIYTRNNRTIDIQHTTTFSEIRHRFDGAEPSPPAPLDRKSVV